MRSVKKALLWTSALALLVVLVVVGIAATYTLDETEQAIVLQFGEPVGEPVTEAGLHFKLPFVQEVRRFEKRLLTWDGDPNEVPTRGRRFISVDTTARWRIVDVRKFVESVTDEAGAQSRLDDVIDSVVRDKISGTELAEIVRSADWEVNAEALRRSAAMPTQQEGVALTERVQIGREELTRSILDEAQKTMPQYGIELVDVRIKRLNYVSSVQKQVFTRMISERQRIAEQFRSEGEGEASRIRGETRKQLDEIQSEAKRLAEVIRGQADGEATHIYNEAYGPAAEFYGFYRTLSSYRTTLKGDTVLLVGTDSDYFRYLFGTGAADTMPVDETGPSAPGSPAADSAAAVGSERMP